MSWFIRKKENITTKVKKNFPKNIWFKTENGKISNIYEIKKNCYVDIENGYHFRIGSNEYFNILFDNNKFLEIDKKVLSKDPLSWIDNKKYVDRIKNATKNNLNEAIRTAIGKINKKKVVISCMDFSFIGGSMGSVVGEKITRAINVCIKNNLPYILISQSGGARMMEGVFSLMQMAKTVAKLTQLSKYRIPYISVLTDPTTGGVTASYALLGDINIAEPNALIGFTGPKIIKNIIGNILPKGFQTSEFLLEKGFIDIIVTRNQLKSTIFNIITMIMN